jgi:putative cell wall-binding protein
VAEVNGVKAMTLRGYAGVSRRAVVAVVSVTVAAVLVLSPAPPTAGSAPEPVEPQVQTVPLEEPADPGSDVVAGATADVGHFAVVGVTWERGADLPDVAVVEARTRVDGRWSGWTEMHHDDAHGPDPVSPEAVGSRPGTEPLVVGDVDQVEIRVLAAEGDVPETARVDVVDPGESPADGLVGTVRPGEASAAAARPGILTRAEWGADESIRGTPSYGSVRGGFVHHTVNANTYAPEDVPAIMRGIYAYHVRTRGWKDIGYNFLVDRFGRIWEGRAGGVARPVVGAHTAGYNDVAFAMSAIGTFTSTTPSQAVLDAYARLFAWKLQLHGVAPAASAVVLNGRTFPAISGHRDAASTECPGQRLYDRIPAIRAAAQALVGSPPRLAGADRYRTATAVARTAFPGSTAVVVVNGTSTSLVDGLVAAPYAAWRRAPVLLAGATGLPAVTADEIRRREARTAYLVGGPAVLGDRVVADLRAAGVTSVVRLDGADRYATAGAVARAMGARAEAVVAAGTDANLVDSIGAGGASAALRVPVLLTHPDRLPDATRTALQAIGVTRTTVVGSDAAVSPAVAASLPSPTRAGGRDRFATAAAVATWAASRGVDVSEVVVTSGVDGSIVDGLAGGTLRRPVLLVRPDVAPEPTLAWLRGRTAVRSTTVLGGPAAVGDAVAAATFPPVR